MLDFIGSFSFIRVFRFDFAYLICCCFASQQHVRSYQDEYRHVIVRTQDDFIVLSHWETRLSPITTTDHALDPPSQSRYPNNAKHLARKRQVSIL